MESTLEVPSTDHRTVNANKKLNRHMTLAITRKVGDLLKSKGEIQKKMTLSDYSHLDHYT